MLYTAEKQPAAFFATCARLLPNDVRVTVEQSLPGNLSIEDWAISVDASGISLPLCWLTTLNNLPRQSARSADSACDNCRPGDFHALERHLCPRRVKLRQRNLRPFPKRRRRCLISACAVRRWRPRCLLPRKVVLDRGASSAFGAGGFLGYNTQWQDLIIGVEATYTHTNLNTTASSSPIGSTSPNSPSISNPHVVSAGGTTNSVNLSGTGNLDLTDYGSVRFRAGYVVGNLLPYGFVGVAVGLANYSVIASITVTARSDISCPRPASNGTNRCKRSQVSALVAVNSAG